MASSTNEPRRFIPFGHDDDIETPRKSDDIPSSPMTIGELIGWLGTFDPSRPIVSGRIRFADPPDDEKHGQIGIYFGEESPR